jgi:2-succinyl-5-enolpyruvyl-6-hydroxy-3-cyclohexene-1-carboxylate synthase
MAHSRKCFFYCLFNSHNEVLIHKSGYTLERLISDKRSVRDLISVLKTHGISDVVISPGSRNAPITNSLFHDPYFRCFSVVDERSAGFFALGLARNSGRMVAAVCTSGSALMNYGPAAAEAFYQQVPVVFISADRPSDRIDKGEGQSIRQVGALATVMKTSLAIEGESETEDLARANREAMNAALILAQSLPKGPVHINVPLRESLYGMIPAGDDGIAPLLFEEKKEKPGSEQTERLRKKLDSYHRILILTGMLEPNEHLNEAIGRWAESGRVLVLTETISNLRNERFISCTDRLVNSLTEEEARLFAPELVITIGHSIISRKIKALVRQSGVSEHWHIGPEPNYDTFDILKEEIRGEAAEVFELLSPMVSKEGNYSDFFIKKNKMLSERQRAFMPEMSFSDLVAFDIILREIPKEQRVEAGNSSVIRYMQLFDHVKGWHVNSNRGVSGIDGSTSTAIGAATASGHPTTLLTGDLAFLYDSNALWSLPLPAHLKIIVINNGGGNIFRIIEGPDRYDSADDYFVARHNRPLRPTVEAHGILCLEARDAESLKEGLNSLYKSEHCAVLEVFTTDRVNPGVLKDYFARLKTI